VDSYTVNWLRNKLQNRIVVNLKDNSVMVYVPAGEFEMGDGHNSDCPKHTIYLSAYWISIYPVTNGQYLKFIEETAHDPPENNSYKEDDRAMYPITDISWSDALRYTNWAECELPTEAQWEKAARGPKGFLYPWGNDWDSAKCQHDKSLGDEGVRPVYDYPGGVSGYGTYNQSGNVWEWCADFYDSEYYRYSPKKDPVNFGNMLYRVNRGGSYWNGGAAYFLSTTRNKNDPTYRASNIGFRTIKRV